MNTWDLIKRNLVQYRRTHAGVFLGAAVGTAILTGALLMGDSVRHSLTDLALARLGKTRVALAGHCFFRSGLAKDLEEELAAPVAPVLRLKGVIVDALEQKHRRGVQVLGVDDRFFEMGDAENPLDAEEEVIVLNEALAAALEVEAGDEVLLRVEKPHPLTREAPLSIDQDLSSSLRLIVKAVVSEAGFGRFSLRANQASPFNAFVSLAGLGKSVGLDGRANLLLVGADSTGDVTLEQADEALKRCFHLADAGLSIQELPDLGRMELKTSRVFLNSEESRAAALVVPGAEGVLTYFVNDLSVGERHAPYSFVAALGSLRSADDGTSVIPSGMDKNEILVNRWLADDLNASIGDSMKLTYFVMGPGRKLEEKEARFRIRSILPMEGAALDENLMPEFPGLAEGRSCRDWNPGIDFDPSRIRDKDEEYWAAYRGTPKAFITLEAGRALWSSRFGSLTAVRCPVSDGAMQRIDEALRQELDLPALGLFFRPVREDALKAGSQGQDFGPLFLGLSFFLIAAALVLVGMLFSLGVEQRKQEFGTLLALGFTWRKAGGLLLCEGILLATGGALLGTLLGVVYTGAMILGLDTFWRDAVARAGIRLHVEWLTLAVGALCGVFMAALAMWITLKRQARHEVRALLNGTGSLDPMSLTRSRGKAGFACAAVSAIAAGALIAFSLGGEAGSGAGTFFGAGALLLVAGMGLVLGLLCRMGSFSTGAALSLEDLGLRNASRRRGRSLSVVAVLACGTFLVFAVGANRKNPLEGADRPGSATGGFSFIGESSLPLLHGLDESAVQGMDVVNLRVREGDDASCLNLNRAQSPRLLGVASEKLGTKRAFTFVKTLDGAGRENPWALLEQDQPDGAVPAVADQATIVWGLDRKLGDTLEYKDEGGRPFSIRLVGALKGSILQGSLLISEERFVELYPSEEGYRVFLVDAPQEKEHHVADVLTRAGRNAGLEVTPAAERLAAYTAVENTYLSIFQVLGGLGLLLGSAGLAIVLLRNVMERRSELAALQAMGYTRASIRKLLLLEHGWLLVTSACLGVAAATVAVWPALSSLGKDLPWASLGITLAAILAGGFLYIWAAAKLSAGREFLSALRNE